MSASNQSKHSDLSASDGTVPEIPGRGGFPQTHWSAVLTAADATSDPVLARRAFEQLCSEYRDAIVHWMRLQHLNPEDAEDAAHDFLEHWLGRENPLRDFERGERRFREFLRVCLRRFLVDWRASQNAKRRGGGALHVPLESQELPAHFQDSSVDMDYALATQIHSGVLARLGARWAAQVSAEAFARVRDIVTGMQDCPRYAVIAHELSVPVGTVKSWVFRFRREYFDSFRDTLLRQVDSSDREQLDDDLVYLLGLILNPPSQARQESSKTTQPPSPDSR